MTKKKLYDVTDLDEVGGIFSALASLSVPWASDISATVLDIEYYNNISGEKRISPLVSRLLGESEKISATNTARLASIAYAMNMPNWTKEYATLDFTYNPIENYRMVETEEINREHDNTVTNTGTQTTAESGTNTGTQGNTVTKTNTGTQTTTNTGTESNTEDQTLETTKSGSSANDIYGFNSSAAVHDTASSISSTDHTTNYDINTRTDNLTETRTDNLSEGVTATRTDNLENSSSGTRTDNLTERDTGENAETRELTRSGNIGVTTSQQMIESERELYMWHFFYNIVFPDIDRVLTLQVY